VIFVPHHYFLFPKLKVKLKGKQFNIILNIQKASIETITKEDFQSSFLKLYDCCKHYISLKVF